jgi:hypothetical protein
MALLQLADKEVQSVYGERDQQAEGNKSSLYQSDWVITRKVCDLPKTVSTILGLSVNENGLECCH